MPIRAKTYRNIGARIKFFGLEVADWGALAALAGAMFTVSDYALMNLALTASAWAWMYRVKGRKPKAYTTALLTHWLSPGTLHVEKEIVD